MPNCDAAAANEQFLCDGLNKLHTSEKPHQLLDIFFMTLKPASRGKFCIYDNTFCRFLLLLQQMILQPVEEKQ